MKDQSIVQPVLLTFDELLTKRLFFIPEYQRAYSWKTAHREALFNDIDTVFQKQGTHFLATMVCVSNDPKVVDNAPHAQLDVVDGQQRLTTLVILLRAIAERFKAFGKAGAEQARDLERRIVKGRDPGQTLLLQTNHDSTHLFTDFVRSGKFSEADAERPNTEADQNVHDAIRQCTAFVSERTKTVGDTDALLYCIWHRLQLILHVVADEALVYSVFEVLNARGLRVSTIDNLKAILMGIAFDPAKGKPDRAVVGELHTVWKNIFSSIAKNRGVGLESVRIAAALCLDEPRSKLIGEDESLTFLTEWCGRSPKKALDLSRLILNIVKAEAVIAADRDFSEAARISSARFVGVALLLKELPAARRDALLEMWSKVSFRIYGLARRDARYRVGKFLKLGWTLYRSSRTDAEVRAEFVDIANSEGLREAVTQFLNEHDAYSDRSSVRYFLYRYELFLAKKLGRNISKAAWNAVWSREATDSIEHVSPQSDKNAEAYCHRLGNLTVLTQTDNSSANARPPTQKVTTYKGSGFLCTEEVAEQIAKERGWKERSVEVRTERLKAFALDEWTVKL